MNEKALLLVLTFTIGCGPDRSEPVKEDNYKYHSAEWKMIADGVSPGEAKKTVKAAKELDERWGVK